MAMCQPPSRVDNDFSVRQYRPVMSLKVLLLSAPFLASVCLPLPIRAQDSSSQPKAQTAETKPPETPAATFVLKQYTRVVNLDVVVEDSKGNR